MGRERLGTGSAPIKFGVFDAGLLDGDEHFPVVFMEFERVGHGAWDCSVVVVDGNKLAKKLVSPGSQVAIELRMMRRIRDDTNRVFAIFPARLPMRGILTGRFEGLEFRISVPPLILECNVA